ncbi:hypothetical protein XENTR_v10005904 [Xenopus tropicalis]|nr:putative tripartite motif-containing protein 75 [Xenopus tropicalis]KAE8624304.1 hypothetical protein XENTR_v10005904 [Xenopus tropicalis]
MAAASLSEKLRCSLCLSIFRDPVMLPCAHLFCNECISTSLDHQRKSGIYICPVCRAELRQRPLLQKNLKLSNIVEHYLSFQQKEEDPEVCIMSSGLAGQTYQHDLKNHSKSEKLTEPTVSLEKNKCQIHNEFLQYFCSEDSAFICMSCSRICKHHGHRMELMTEAFQKKRKTLCDFLKKIHIRTEETEKKLQRLQEREKRVQGKATEIKERVATLFKDIREEILTLEYNIISEVTRQEKQVSFTVNKLIHRLEMETADLQAKRCHVEQLCSMTDPLALLKQTAINTDLGKKRSDNTIDELDEVSIAVELQKSFSKLSDVIPKLKRARGFLVEDASDMILNVDTADLNIALSPDLRNASYCKEKHSRPHHPERFMTQQVLSTKQFSSGQHYWQVKSGNAGDWYLGVAYNSVERKGDTSYIGSNNKSWCLSWVDKEFIADHDDEHEVIKTESSTLHFGIYLDYEGGQLSFYELSEPIKHLYTFRATFTEPLHAAFYIDEGCWLQIGN